MRGYSDRRSPARLFLRRLGLAALAVVLVAALWGVWGAFQKERESAGLRAQAERERDDLAARDTKLSNDLASLQTDRGKEETLREQYALAEQGERLIVIVDPSTTTPIEATSSRNWFQRTFWPW